MHTDSDTDLVASIPSSLEWVPYDCLWEICGYLANDYRSIGCLMQTCRAIEACCREEFVWRDVARCCIPWDIFRPLEEAHARFLATARADACRRFRIQQLTGAIDPNETLFAGCGDVTDMSLLVPSYFRDRVRAHVLRAVTRNIQLFIEAAMNSSSTCSHGGSDVSNALSEVKRREGDLRAYFSHARDITFPQHCIGRSGAALLAASLSLCSGPSCHLTTLDLTNQLIRDQGAESILAAIVGSRGMLWSLQTLCFANNKLTDGIAEWLGNFLQQAVERGGSLRVLDLSENPNLCEASMIQLSLGLERGMFGADRRGRGHAEAIPVVQLLDTADGLGQLLRECNDCCPMSPRCISWARCPLRTLSLNRTSIGRCQHQSGKGKPSSDPFAAPMNSLTGRGALCSLLGCFALLRAALAANARKEEQEHQRRAGRNQAYAHRGPLDCRPAAAALGSLNVHVAAEDCGFDATVIVASTEYLITATSTCSPSGAVQATTTSRLSISFRFAPASKAPSDDPSAVPDTKYMPNNIKSFQYVLACVDRLPTESQQLVHTLATKESIPSGGRTNALADEAKTTDEEASPKIAFGPAMSVDVSFPNPKDKKNKSGGCCVM
jgi:hypothetical protein